MRVFVFSARSYDKPALQLAAGNHELLFSEERLNKKTAHYAVDCYAVALFTSDDASANWMKILGRLFRSENNDSLHGTVSMAIKAYYDFIKGMALVYVAVGILNSIGLLLLGVPHAILFGFIASILMMVAIGVGTAAFGVRFRVYSILTMLTLNGLWVSHCKAIPRS